MESNERKINKNLMTGWVIIVVVLLVAYFGEYLKGERSGIYMLVFSIVTALPPIVCILMYRKNKRDDKLRYYILGGYFIMYAFVLLTGSTTMVFTYILPMLSLIVLYHHASLVLVMGVLSLIANLIFIARMFLNHQITLSNSKDIEIQLALLILCFGFLYIASRMYDDTVRKNAAYLDELDTNQKQLERVTLQTITTIANIIDAKDEYTKGHSQRVAEYASSIARELGYDAEYVQNVNYIGLLHDIGKIGIPDAILNKPGRLADNEFSLMKEHVVIGANILKDNGMIDNLLDGVKYHHERYDGKGYPEGLSGESIPQIARIIGIADAYDAMTSNRVYRKRLSDEDVIKEIERCAGTQFDPRIAHVFISMIQENKISQLSPDTFVSPQTLGEQSVNLLKDILKRQSEQDALDQNKDYLTSTYNRNIGERKITQYLSEADGALLLIDIQNLREVNGKYGFVGGDHLIRMVAEFLLDYAENTIISRFSGDEFLCFVCGMEKRDALQSFMEKLFTALKEYIHTKDEYRIATICIGGALSVETGREYSKLFLAADKALYHMKQCRYDGVYLYSESEPSPDSQRVLSKTDLEQLVETIKQENRQGTYYALLPEFKSLIDFTQNLGKRNVQDVTLILLTLFPVSEKNTTVAERDEAMQFLENAINGVLRKTDIMTRFSSTQCLILLIGVSMEHLNEISTRIMNNFYKIYDRKNMVVSYDAAQINTAE